MNNYCVYLHIRPDKKEVFYVGKGSLKRPYEKRGRNNIWKKIVDKNNNNYQIIIFEEGLTNEEACSLEINLIETYGRIDLNTGPLSNMTKGGEGIGELSQEVRDKIGLANRGKKRTKEMRLRMSKAQTGKKRSEKTKKRLSIVNTGKKLSEETKKKISESNKGKIIPPEIIKKAADAQRGKKISRETRDKISKANTGKKRSEEVKKKMSEIGKNRFFSEDHRKNISQVKRAQTKVKKLLPILRDSHPDMVDIFTKGSCANLFIFIRSIYQGAKPFYNDDHIITKVGQTFFDITGKVDPKGYLPLTEINYPKKRISKLLRQ